MTKIWEAMEWMRNNSAPNWAVGVHSPCMNSALLAVEYRGRCTDEVLDDLHAIGEVCEEQFPERTNGFEGMGAVWFFNDDEATTFDEIQMVMEKAAIRRTEIVLAEK